MMRREFPKAVKLAAFQRANGRCEECSARLMVGAFHYDHRVPDALGGEPTLENCRVLCRACHAVKTAAQDVPSIAKAKRNEARHIGAKAPSRTPLPFGRRSRFKRKISGEIVAREER